MKTREKELYGNLFECCFPGIKKRNELEKIKNNYIELKRYLNETFNNIEVIEDEIYGLKDNIVIIVKEIAGISVNFRIIIGIDYLKDIETLKFHVTKIILKYWQNLALKEDKQ